MPDVSYVMTDESLNSFLEGHQGILTLLGLFMIFLGTASNQIFPKIEGIVDFSSGSTFIWLGAMLIVLVCLFVLIKNALKYPTWGVKLFAALLLLLLLPLALYLLISVLLNKHLVGAVQILPKSVFIAIFIIGSLFVVIGVNKIPLKWLRRTLHIVLPAASILFLICRGIWASITVDLVELNILTWFFISLIISYTFSVYYLIKDKLRTHS